MENKRDSYRTETLKDVGAAGTGEEMHRSIETHRSKESKTLKNLCAKTRPTDNPYEVWQSHDGTWTWNVLKKWQANDDKPYARWFCNVVTPIMPYGELGDCYVKDIKRQARRIR